MQLNTLSPRQSQYTESQLIYSIKNKDQAAFTYLYDNYAGALYSIIFKMVSDENLADDILQKVFINIWEKIEGYDSSRGRLFTWMLNIARNATIDTLRSKDFRTHHKLQPIGENDSNPAYTVLKTDAIGIMKYVSRLKPLQKQLIELIYFHGYSQPEIATMQGMPLSTIKTRVRTALIQLRILIGEKLW